MNKEIYKGPRIFHEEPNQLKIYYLIQTGALLDMAGHGESEGVCG